MIYITVYTGIWILFNRACSRIFCVFLPVAILICRIFFNSAAEINYFCTPLQRPWRFGAAKKQK